MTLESPSEAQKLRVRVVFEAAIAFASDLGDEVLPKSDEQALLDAAYDYLFAGHHLHEDERADLERIVVEGIEFRKGPTPAPDGAVCPVCAPSVCYHRLMVDVIDAASNLEEKLSRRSDPGILAWRLGCGLTNDEQILLSRLLLASSRLREQTER